MAMRAFGQVAEVPTVGQGTWNMERDDRRSCIAALRRGVELGMTHLDTAELYGRGQVEALVREALGPVRDQLFVVSKVLPSNASRRGTVAACEQSLARLGTDRLDCLLLHWPGSYRLEDTFAGFEELVAGGKIRSYGVSNFDEQELAVAVKVAGAGKLACNQVLYHLEERRIEHAVIQACEAAGVTVVAYSPFGSGEFPAASSSGGRVLGRVAAAHGATPHQVALAFLTRRPSVLAIPKAAGVAHVEDNARAEALMLSAAELAEIDAAFPLGRRRGGVPTL